MKWLRTLILFDQGAVASSDGWEAVHESYRRSIQSIEHPAGTGLLTLRPKERRPGSSQFNRNGVGYLRSSFLRHMVDSERWEPEADVDLGAHRRPPAIRLYPGLEGYSEPIASEFGGFDFVTTAADGVRVAIEWETGNISSSHRSMNKLAIALKAGIIQAGVLIVPSQSLYVHLTDRIGNIRELSGYLELWAGLGATVNRGLLAITVVEHDELDGAVPYLPTGNDGRAAEGRTKG